MAETIKEISDQLGRIFRHIVPGLVVVAGAKLAYPVWFNKLNLSNTYHVVVLAAITVVAGNVWYVLHRYTVHQVIDYILHKVKRKVPGKSYVEWLADFIERGFRSELKMGKLGEHLYFRSSQIILMFIVSEVFFIFALFCDGKNFVADNRWKILIISVLIFFFSVWQYYISNTVDWIIVDKDIPPD